MTAAAAARCCCRRRGWSPRPSPRFLAAAFAYLPVAYLLRYARLSAFTRPAAWHLGLLLALPAALLHERVVRGLVYPRLRGRLRVGFGAPA